MKSKIEEFYQNLQHNDYVEEQIQQSGIINSYILTTKSAMNARRDANLCLWCDEIWSVDHNCENAFEFNCMFTFGEEGEGVALIIVSSDALKCPTANNTFRETGRSDSSISKEERLICDANHVFDDLSTSKIEFTPLPSSEFQEDLQVPIARNMFDEMPIPDFILEMAQAAKITQDIEAIINDEDNLMCDIDELHVSVVTTLENFESKVML
ncbi:hypothetical protein RND81_11G099800 [Saponaria officinalis]|uniref:Uncharacterized protein n=1 Tax=Saponaria officinalis TaxID=3572 RepID=A0AAW1HKA2_SAPOF